MSKFAPMKELYLSCECMDLDHVALFIHFPPSEDGSKCVMEDDDDAPCIYMTVTTNNYYNDLLPPLRYFYEKYDWQSFFAHNWYKRLWIAGRYLVNHTYRPKWGILNCFDFQDKDLEKLDAFMALISSDIDTTMCEGKELWLDDEKWLIKIYISRFEIEKHNYKGPWEVGWEPHFKPRGFFGRVKYAFKYIFGTHCEEKQFTIEEKEAAKIRGMIKWTQETNKKDEDAKKN